MTAMSSSKPPTAADQPKFLVRHGVMRFVGEFTAPPAGSFRRHEGVIVRTDRGTEHGELLCPSTPQTIAHIPDPTRGQILRSATFDDRKKISDLKAVQEREYETGQRLVNDHRLAMQIVDVEHLFGGERIVFYFLAESRVDFRELVKSMAREFHTRIELRQIGVRDEAKLKADYGDCGKPVCCNTFMVVMPPVSMRMAKLQKSTLDPTKISGRCGRLKCCLRFEQDVYEAHQMELPAVGSRVLTNKGQGRVLAQEVLARRLLVEFEDGRRMPVPADDVLTKL
jgi:cell fate regulator YaaT (PSP1 superfamily)